MGRIQSNIGLITGMPIGDTVAQLMALAGAPRDMLVDRTTQLQAEEVAVSELAASLYSVKFITDNLGRSKLFYEREATSSNPDVLSALVYGTPPSGTFQFTPLRTVQSQQMLSTAFRSDTDSLDSGRMTFRFGSHIQRTAMLQEFNSGEGIVRGMIRITDRSGARANIDLSGVQTVGDVVEAINSNVAIDVTAVSRGDGFELIDHTGKTASNLLVEEVGRGKTAASLGLDGIDVAASVATGRDMLQLYADIDLNELNDGNGVRTDTVVHEIEYTLADGTTGQIDFSPIVAGGSNIDKEATLGDILDAINATAPGQLRAEIAADGDRLTVTDLTSGTETFQFNATADTWTLADLGLDGEAVGGVITGRRLYGGAGTVLLESLNGGRGLGTLGALELNDRSGVSDTVDLSAAETVDEVIQIINAANVGIVARVNAARNGIELLDTTGGSAANLLVANADGTATADKLGIAIDADVAGVNSGDMHLQVIAENTKLEDLNGGIGVAKGTFDIYDSMGRRDTVNLMRSNIETIGDLIDEINRLSVDVLAEINETGDGIRIIDLSDGLQQLKISDGRSGTAEDLHLTGDLKEIDYGGAVRSVIDGSTTISISLDVLIDEDTLLDDLNNGDGIARGTFTVRDSMGQCAILDLAVPGIETIGDLVDLINSAGLSVDAEVNETRDGLRIVDRGAGGGKLQIYEGNSTTAADLNLLRESVDDVDHGDVSIQVIDTAGGVHSLQDLRDRINELGAGVTATILNDGSSRPYRLSLVSEREGAAGQLVVDLSEAGFSMNETVRARDALLAYGRADQAASTVLISSNTNSFRNVLPGVALTVKQPSDVPVTVTIARTDASLTTNVRSFVDNYNAFREKLTEATAFDATTQTGSILTGDPAAMRLDSDLSYLLSGRFVGAGAILSLAELGINLKSNGELEFDETKLKARFADDPDAIEEFFATEDFGVSAKFDQLIEQLGGEESSLLSSRIEALQRNITKNQERIEYMNGRLEEQSERLYMQFYRMEIAIGKMQTAMSVIQSLQPIAPLMLANNS